MHIFTSLWGSEQAIANLVVILDYAGIIDAFGALVLLWIWWKTPSEKSERKLALIAILTSFLAAVLWVLDSKVNHRLSFLQAESFTKSRDELAAKSQWRKLDSEKREKLIDCLKNAPKGLVSVFGDATSTEAQNFAALIAEAIEKAGFEVRPYPEEKIPFMIYSPGIFLTFLNATNGGQLPDPKIASNAPKDPDFHPDSFLLNAPPHARAIQNCLWNIGISANGSLPGNISCRPGEVVIVVGRRY